MYVINDTENFKPKMEKLQVVSEFYHNIENLVVLSKCVILYTAEKMKFSAKDFFSNCQQIREKLQICPYLLQKSLMGNLIFYATVDCRIAIGR